eukprot:738328_1
MILEGIGTCIAVFVAYALYDRLLRFSGDPPGPFRWPIIGNLNILFKFSIRDQLLRPFVEQQFSSSQPTANASNYIDLVVQKRNRSAENGKKMQSYFDSENIQYIASKLIAAGG